MKEVGARKLQAQKTKSHIIEVASGLLKEKTLDEINVTDICTAAGVSVGAFYHHFQNKEFIIVELYKMVDVFFEKDVYPRFEKKQAEIIDVSEYLVAQCEYALKLGIDLVQNAYKSQINYGSEFFLSKSRGLAKCLVLLLQRMQDNQLIKSSVVIDELAEDVLLISRGIIYNWCVCGGKSNMIKKTRRLISSYLQAVAV